MFFHAELDKVKIAAWFDALRTLHEDYLKKVKADKNEFPAFKEATFALATTWSEKFSHNAQILVAQNPVCIMLHSKKVHVVVKDFYHHGNYVLEATKREITVETANGPEALWCEAQCLQAFAEAPVCPLPKYEISELVASNKGYANAPPHPPSPLPPLTICNIYIYNLKIKLNFKGPHFDI